MRNTNSAIGMISRCPKLFRASFSRLFSRIPNLASHSDIIQNETPHDDNANGELNDWYGKLLAKIHQGPDGDKLDNVEQLQQAVTEIVRDGKQQMANAESTEEILFMFMAGMYKIKSLM